MKRKSRVRKMIVAVCWLLAGTGVIVLLVAAIRNKNNKTCQGYEIGIEGGGDHWFMDKKDIVQQLTGNGAGALKGRSIQSFDLRKLEEKLQKNVWVKKAELFFDNNGILKVRIEEREPATRIFTSTGYSFYIDSTGSRLPLSDKLSARLPVFTGFPSDKEKLNSADSLLLVQVRKLSAYLRKDAFWMAQIAQVDITADKKFELIPSIGDHVIQFGNADSCEKKFKRLLTFYQKVLTKAGMNTYEKINVQYNRQVIGVRRSGAASGAAIVQPAVVVDSIVARNTEKPTIVSAPKPVTQQPNPGKQSSPVKSRSYETLSKPVKNDPAKPPVKSPKAVMPARQGT